MSDEFVKTPIHLVSSLVGVLRQYFGTENRITMDSSKYMWREDLKKSDLWIAEEFNPSVEIVGKRPSILVGYLSGQIEKSVIADMMAYIPNGEVRNFELTRAQVPFKCISTTAIASVELATELRYFMSVFREQIQKDYCIDYLRPSQFTGPQRVEEYKEYWTSQVICDIVYQENWGVVIEHLRVKSINIDLQIK
jgi:hypothetical protein